MERVMAAGLGLVGRQGAQDTMAKLVNGKTVEHTDAAGKSIQQSKAALDAQKKVQAMQSVTRAGG